MFCSLWWWVTSQPTPEPNETDVFWFLSSCVTGHWIYLGRGQNQTHKDVISSFFGKHWLTFRALTNRLIKEIINSLINDENNRLVQFMRTMWNTSFRGKAHLKCSYWSREAGSGSDGQKCRCKMLWYWPKRWLRSEPLIRTKTDIFSEPVTDRLKSQHNSCWISVFSCTFFITNLLWN